MVLKAWEGKNMLKLTNTIILSFKTTTSSKILSETLITYTTPDA